MSRVLLVFFALLGATGAFARFATPIYFEPNQGQAKSPVRYLARAGSATLLLTDDGAVLRAHDDSSVKLSLPGAHWGGAELLDPLPGVSYYLTRSSASGLPAGIPHYGKLRYHNVYPGIDLVFYANGQELEYDFVIAPHANPEQIRLAFSTLGALRLDREGNLQLGK